MSRSGVGRSLAQGYDIAAKVLIATPPMTYRSLRAMAFPITVLKSVRLPPIRKDVAAYEDLFAGSETQFARIVKPYGQEQRWSLGETWNGFFQSVDLELYYSIIRAFKPENVLELGSGNSTWVASVALRANSAGRLRAVDPASRLRLPESCEHLRSREEDLPPGEYERLHRNDVLFIDSSHSRKEAVHYTTEVFPRLGAGVVIHCHDISFPYDFSGGDVEASGESDVVLEFLREEKASFRVLASAPYACYKNLELVKSLVPSLRRNPLWRPRSLWFTKLDQVV